MGKPIAPSKLDFTGTKLLIGLPTRGTCSIHFAASLAASCCLLNAARVEINIVKGQNSCFVDMNRNKLLAKFLESDCTHILMIDDDMGFDPMAPLKMLKHDREFIAGVGNLKSDEGKDFACKLFTQADQTPVVDSDGLLKASHVGGAFILIKKSLVQKMASAYPELKNPIVDPQFGFRFFESEYTMNSWTTEDYKFCERWTAIGGEIWCFPDISFIHSGMKDYKGNYHEFLLGQPRAEIMTDVQKMSEIDKALETMADKPVEVPKPRANGFVTALEKVMLSEAYVRRIASKIIDIQNESNQGMQAYSEQRAGL
jgi:hypothetical protein